MNQEKIGEFIKKIRKQNNMTQKDLAAKYNITYQAISNWEQGKNIPDISLLKQISKDFNVSLDELLDGENKKRKNNKIYIFVIGLIILLIIFIGLIINNKKDKNFEFKTLTSTCSNFTISGNIAYNNNKTAIFINNVNYCGGDDTEEYSEIECVLYEVNNDIEKKISSYNYDNSKKIKLEEFLKNVEFTVDDYDRTCKKYSNESLYLKINAKNKDDKITSYKIPLSLNETCEK